MKFKNLDAKHAAIAPLIYGTLSGSYLTMVNSIDSGVTWKIICAVAGFIIFAGFATVYSVGIYRKISENESQI